MSHPLAHRLRLIVITDPGAEGGLLAAGLQALSGGAPAIQLRWKEARTADLLAVGAQLVQACREHGALLIVNDRVDVALAIGAHGVHLGDDDMPLAAARAIVPAGFLLGRSVDTPEEAVVAEESGADYVGVGPIYATGSKQDAGPVLGVERLAAFRARVAIPIVAIGGIEEGRAAAVIRAGADGVAVIRGVMANQSPDRAAAALLAEVRSALD